MRPLLTLLLLSLSISGFAQQMSLTQWEEEAKTNIRLLPKYGNVPKTEAQKNSDQAFIADVLKQDSTHRKASDHMISLGFKYLYRDTKTAMYRFNQAWLLDSTNTDVYWGYGGVYMTLGNFTAAEKQFVEGLSINPENTHLLTDYGTYFMSQYYNLQAIDKGSATSYLDSAVSYISKSYQLDPSDQNSSFKLSVCYYLKADCSNAWKFYHACMALGGQPITDNYTKDLEKICKR